MNTEGQIKAYILGQAEPKRSDMQTLHNIIQNIRPNSKHWFLDGKKSENKTVSNPNIGYGSYPISYADGKTKEFSDRFKRQHHRNLRLYHGNR
jgi:hypothetical protein